MEGKSARFFGGIAGGLRAIGLMVVVMSLAAPSVSAQQSAARVWMEELLEAIRHDFARPTVHARNLFHTSVAMYDAWAVYSPDAYPYLAKEVATAPNIAVARNEAISFAAYRVLSSRFALSPNAAISQAAFDARMDTLGYNRNFTSTLGASPAAVGNRVAIRVLNYGLKDGANEAGGYANLFYEPINPPLLPDFPGNPDILDVNRWQPLALQFFVDQAGNPIPFGYPEFLSPEWGAVSPFSLTPNNLTIYNRDGFDYWVYHDPGPPPQMFGPREDEFKRGFEQVLIWSGQMDPADNVWWDVSPASLGNSPLADPSQADSFFNLLQGGDWGTGYAMNPVTGLPYQPQIVPRGDYTRILAEFWADGPSSETPPGHWFALLNYVGDHPMTVKRLGGQGPVLGALEWDVKSYLALGGAMHDVAIAAWGVKGWYDFIRPVSAIRYLSDQGQCSDPNQPSFNPNGIHLYPGYIEVVTAQSTAPGQRHAHLIGEEGKIAARCWRGPEYISDPATDVAGCGWILAENWWPYQRPTFVTPPFAGYVSGHSTYSRAAAELMTILTGSEFFPGGIGIFDCPQNEFLVFEDGPSMNVELQWARYADASDQCSLSRIWGGIHPPADDLPGRQMGNVIGPEAYDHAIDYFEGTVLEVFEDCVSGPGNNSSGLGCVRSDRDNDGDVDLRDYADLVIAAGQN